MAMCAREMKKPFYVLTESFKFVRLYPLNQRDLPNEFKVSIHSVKNNRGVQ
jgi:translation initiation factor eIF-2B subunit alpha